MEWLIYLVIAMFAVIAGIASSNSFTPGMKRILAASAINLLIISVIVNFIINGLAEGVLSISLSFFSYALGRKPR